MPRVILFFLFGLQLLTVPVAAQRNIKDSLNSLLKTQLTPIAKIDVLNQLAYQYYDYNDSLALNYADEALRLAKQVNYPKGMK